MNELMTMIWGATILGNTILALLLVWRGWYVRYSWLTISTGIAVICDVLLWKCPNYSYEPSRLFVFYSLYYMLDALVIWEAWKLRNRRVHIPVEIGFAISFAVLIAKHAQFLWDAYFIECFLRGFNLAVIVWFILIFRKESRYER